MSPNIEGLERSRDDGVTKRHSIIAGRFAHRERGRNTKSTKEDIRGTSNRRGCAFFAFCVLFCAFCAAGLNGPEGVRTPDLMTASHARSQLRHRPVELQPS